MRTLLLAFTLTGILGAQSKAAPDPDAFVPDNHAGMMAVDVAALRSAGLLEELLTLLADAGSLVAESRTGLALEHLQRVRVFLGTRTADDPTPRDLRLGVAILEGTKGTTLASGDTAERTETIGGYTVQLPQEDAENPRVRVVIAPELIVQGLRHRIEPLLTGAAKPGRPDAELVAMAAPPGTLALAGVPLPANAESARPRLAALRLVRDPTKQQLALEVVLRFGPAAGKPAEVEAAAKEVLAQVRETSDFEAFAPLLDKIVLRSSDGELVARVEIASLLDLRPTIEAIAELMASAPARQQRAAVEFTTETMKMVREAAKLYRLRNGRWPTVPELTTPDDRGGKFLDGEPLDAWKRPLQLRVLDNKKLEIRSLGPDGVEGTDDDIVG